MLSLECLDIPGKCRIGWFYWLGGQGMGLWEAVRGCYLKMWAEELTKGESTDRKGKWPWSKLGASSTQIGNWKTMKNDFKHGQLEATSWMPGKEVGFREISWAECYWGTREDGVWEPIIEILWSFKSDFQLSNELWSPSLCTFIS